jgi:hypothetical protein
MYGWLVKEQKGWLLSTSINSVEPWLHASSYIFPGPGQSCYPLPATGRNVPASGFYLDNVDFLKGFHGKSLLGKKSKKIETRKEV